MKKTLALIIAFAIASPAMAQDGIIDKLKAIDASYQRVAADLSDVKADLIGVKADLQELRMGMKMLTRDMATMGGSQPAKEVWAEPVLPAARVAFASSPTGYGGAGVAVSVGGMAPRRGLMGACGAGGCSVSRVRLIARR